MSSNKNLNTQKFIEDTLDIQSLTEKYQISNNLARDIDEVNSTRSYVIRNDGINISDVIFPHNMQIGLGTEYKSNLKVQGNVTIDGDLEVRGQTTGIELSGGASGGKFVFQSRDTCTLSPGRLFPWYSNSAAIGGTAFGNMDGILIMPFTGTITAMSLHVKSNSTNYGNIEKITVDFYKSQPHATRTSDYTQDTRLGAHPDGDEMEILIDNFDGSSSNLYYKSHSINISVNAGDVFQVQHQRVGGTSPEILFSMTLVESS